VTGGAGFIGSHLAGRLLRDGSNVVILDNLSTGRLENLEATMANRRLRVIRGDILSPTKVREGLKEVDSVVHLAAQASVPDSIANPRRTHEINVRGTKALLMSCTKAGVEQFIFASTCAVYGNPARIPIGEQSPVDPLSPYASSKLSGEELCRDVSRFAHGSTILRFFNVYGPRQERSPYGAVISSFVDRLKSGKRPLVFGDGHQTRDFVYVSDVVESIVLAMKRKTGGVFNVGSGRECSILDLEGMLAKMLRGRPVTPEFREARPGEIARSLADITLARKMLGFSPRFTLEAGLRDMLRG
jgi:UDP-glucose 4-epimerase